jgi:hypothetical protein
MRDFPWRAPFLACRLAFAPNFITTASSANGNSSAAQPTPIVNPSALQFETELAQAQLMEKDGNWNAAEQLLTSVIDDEGAPKSLRDQSKLELEKILASRRQLAQLDLIEKYISDGRMDLDRPSKQLSSLLSKASSEIVIRRVASLSNKDEPFIYWKPVIKVTTWIANVLPYLFVFFVMGIIRAALFFCYGARSGEWVLADITDSTSCSAVRF